MSDHGIDVHRVATLARIELSPEEADALSAELGTCLEYIAVLNRLDTDSVAPTSHPLPLSAPFRADRVEDPLERDRALANAPESDGESFMVPKVVG